MARYTITVSPGRLVLSALLSTILIGTLLLMLPLCQNIPVSFIDCFFTSTSATCCTGILTVQFDSFSYVGKCIILLLMQIGGIGIVTLLLSITAIFTKLKLTTQLIATHILDLDTWKDAQRVLLFIIGFSLTIELFGASIIYWLIRSNYTSSAEALFYAFFHSVSSFCSVGLIARHTNMIQYAASNGMLLVTGFLILCGGLGFFTWYDFFENYITGERKDLTLNTRVVVRITAMLILGLTVLLLLLEGSTHFTHLPWYTRVINMLFNAIAYRSAGLTSMAMPTLQVATVFLIVMYSLIGSSPGSTGSGIKVTTFAIFIATIRTVISGEASITIMEEKIYQEQIFKALAIFSFSLFWIIISTICLAVVEPQLGFANVFFETVSTFTTLGLATDITPYLSFAGKLLVMINMMIGRVGPLTLLLALRSRHEIKEYLHERLMIG